MAPLQLFMMVEPAVLDRYTKKKVERTTSRPLEVVRGVDVLRRALQALPPRELYMLYAVKVLRVEQDDVSDLFNVRQSNVSYRLDRASYRIKLFAQLHHICSETKLRQVLYKVGLAEPTVRAVLGVIKTSSQTAAAEALKVNQGSVRNMFSTALEKLSLAKDSVPGAPEAFKYLSTIEANYNHLRPIDSQRRWAWKVGDTDRLSSVVETRKAPARKK